MSNLKQDQLVLMYKLAWLNQDYQKIENLCLNPMIKPYFQFLEQLYDNFVEQKKFKLIPIPYFHSKGNFKSVVKSLTGPRFNQGLIKRFGKQTEKHGVQFLNNIHALNRIYDVNLNIDSVLNLDHSKAITNQTMLEMQKLGILKNKYSLQRLWNLIADVSPELMTESYHLIIYNVDDYPDAVNNSLPDKPKSMQEIHDAISLSLIKEKKENHLLNQDISHLNGKMIFNLTIEIPEDSHTLKLSSLELKHCVHSYDRMVIRKECQIINLLLDETRIYTIELRPEGSTYRISQFKGLRNENSMEGAAGESYRNEILKLLKEGK